jgi:hypothetical protein
MEKINKYRGLLPQLKTVFGAENGEILPIVVGTRGAMPKETITALGKLGITDASSLKTISLMALRYLPCFYGL